MRGSCSGPVGVERGRGQQEEKKASAAEEGEEKAGERQEV